MNIEMNRHPLSAFFVSCRQIARAACYSGSVFGFFVVLLGLVIVPWESDRIWGNRQLSPVSCSLHDGERALVVVRGRHADDRSGFTTSLAVADLKQAAPTLIAIWPNLSPACVAAIPGTSRALVSTTSGELYTVDLDAPESPPVLIGRHQSAPFEVVCSTDGRMALTLTGNAIFAWDLDAKKLRWQFTRGFVRAVALRPDSVLAALDAEGSVVEIALNTGLVRRTVVRHPATVLRIVVDPDDRCVALVTGDAQLIVAELASGAVLWKHQAPLGGLPHLAFSADGKRLASAVGSGSGWSITVWNAQRGTFLESLIPQAALIHGLSYSGNERLVSWSADGAIRVWDDSRQAGQWQLASELLGSAMYRRELPQ